MVSAPYARKNGEKIAVRAVKAYILKSILPTYVMFSRGRSHIYMYTNDPQGKGYVEIAKAGFTICDRARANLT